ncbi:hypothetical protein SAMN02745220_04646 [Desulfopila aestuarii DSM 18488]|uniref:Uncharacterized protein n=1 Tax=Desulfopila aestuarii DSM 18488 TaxID=1121416 RepID=A0A1M7YIX1_9BACT|nr:hypothetical protein SAMN02745220_04646 [Desulfopila aestuarii DSM 18488]
MQLRMYQHLLFLGEQEYVTVFTNIQFQEGLAKFLNDSVKSQLGFGFNIIDINARADNPIPGFKKTDKR